MIVKCTMSKNRNKILKCIMSKKKYAKDTSCEFKGLQFQGIFRRGFPRFFSVFYILFECFTGHHRIPVKKLF